MAARALAYASMTIFVSVILMYPSLAALAPGARRPFSSCGRRPYCLSLVDPVLVAEWLGNRH
jgi:hypothetical protein